MLTATNPLLRNITVTSLWKCNELIVTQQEPLRYHGNAIWCIDHVTKENLICHNYILAVNHYGPTIYIAFHGTKELITLFTRAHQWKLFYASSSEILSFFVAAKAYSFIQFSGDKLRSNSTEDSMSSGEAA
jgi:hypothetical protein